MKNRLEPHAKYDSLIRIDGWGELTSADIKALRLKEVKRVNRRLRLNKTDRKPRWNYIPATKQQTLEAHLRLLKTYLLKNKARLKRLSSGDFRIALSVMVKMPSESLVCGATFTPALLKIASECGLHLDVCTVVSSN